MSADSKPEGVVKVVQMKQKVVQKMEQKRLEVKQKMKQMGHWYR